MSEAKKRKLTNEYSTLRKIVKGDDSARIYHNSKSPTCAPNQKSSTSSSSRQGKKRKKKKKSRTNDGNNTNKTISDISSPSSSVQAPNAAFVVDIPSVLEMIGMGFDRELAVHALSKNENDIENSIAWACKELDRVQLKLEEEKKAKEIDHLEVEEERRYNIAVEQSLMEKERQNQLKANEISKLKIKGDILGNENFKNSRLIQASIAISEQLKLFHQIEDKEEVAEESSYTRRNIITTLRLPFLRSKWVELLLLERSCSKWYSNPAESYFSKCGELFQSQFGDVCLNTNNYQEFNLLPSNSISIISSISKILLWIEDQLKLVTESIALPTNGKTPQIFIDAHNPPTIDLSVL